MGMWRGLRVALGLAALAAGASGVWWSLTAAAAPPAALTVSAPFDVVPPPAVASRMRALAARPPVNRVAAGPAQDEPVLITTQNFEGEAFPPEGWQAGDNLAATDPQYVWSRETCDVQPTQGGMASAWAVGGGAQGSQLACGASYKAAVDSWLIYGPIDASTFAGGLQANLMVRMNQANPNGGNLQVCSTSGPEVSRVRCRGISPADSAWGSFRDPLLFDWSAGLSQVIFVVRYVDDQVPGSKFGAFVDNIRVEGLTEQTGPTPTNTAEPPPPTNTRRPATNTPVRPPTTVPSPTPRAAGEAFLPLLMRSAPRNDLMPPASSGVSVAFGLDIDESNNLIQPGSVFQYGVLSLCARMSWWGQSGTTLLTYQWFRNDRKIDGLAGSRPNAGLTGAMVSCVQGGEDDQGNPIPVPLGKYEVAVYVNNSTVPTGLGQVVIQTDPPPGATPIPTGGFPTREPTEPPEPTPTGEVPTITPTPEPGGCRSWLTNPSFESGPQDWAGIMDGNAVQVDPMIVQGSTLGLTAADGQWLAMLGRLQGSTNEVLIQPWPPRGALVDPDRMESASLQMNFGLVTDETKNGTHDDTLISVVADQTGRAEAVPRAGFSEEVIDPNNWYNFASPVDVTELLTKRAGWETMAFGWQGHNSADKRSIFLVDNVQLTVCERSGSPGLGSLLPSAPGVPKAALRLRAATAPVTAFAAPVQLRKLGPMAGPPPRAPR